MAKVKFNLGGVIIEKELDELSQASESESTIELKSDDLVIYKTDEFETFKTNLKNDEYSATKDKANEMAMKAIKNASGFDIEGYKDPETFASAFKQKVIEDANIAPTQKIKDLETDVQTLQQNLLESDKKYNDYVSEQDGIRNRANKDTTLLGFIPSTGLKVDTDIALMALKNKANVDISFDDNKTLVTMNGQVVKDPKTLQPVDPNVFVTDKITELGLVDKASGGGGGGDEAGAAKGSYEDFQKRMEAQGVNPNSQEYSEKMQQEINDGTLKV